MRIILDEKEILEAIEADIQDQVKIPDDFRIDIDLKATRGPEGYQAFIDILPMNAPVGDRSVDDRIEANENAQLGIAQKIEAARAAAKAPRRRGRPAGARNKTTVERENAEKEPEVQNEHVEETQTAETVNEVPVENVVNEPVNNEPVATTTGSPISEESTDAAPVTENEAPRQEAETLGENNEVAVTEEVTEEVAEPAESVVQTSTVEPVGEATITNEDPIEQTIDEAQAVQSSEIPVEVDPAPAATVTEGDVTAQASEKLTDSISDAGDTEAQVQHDTAVQEAVQEEIRAVASEEAAPAEVAGESTEVSATDTGGEETEVEAEVQDEAVQAPAPSEAPRSLFAGLGPVTNNTNQ